MASPVHSNIKFEESDSLTLHPELLPVLASVLKQLASRNDSLPFVPNTFHAPRVPAILFEAYLGRIKKYAGCSDACFVAALIYIDRVIQSHPEFVVNSLCLHRLFFVCVVTATKYYDDHYYDNLYYSKVGGVTLGELNRLEIDLLFLIDWRLTVPGSVFNTYRAELLKSLAPVPSSSSSSATNAMVSRPRSR